MSPADVMFFNALVHLENSPEIAPARVGSNMELAAFFNTAGPLQPAYGWGDGTACIQHVKHVSAMTKAIFRKSNRSRVYSPNSSYYT
eukprot:4044481-Amphidinium_carterae.1